MRYLLLILLLIPSLSWGAIDLPWSSTWDSGEWTQADGLYSPQFDCDGMNGWGAWTCPSGSQEAQITTPANMTAGDGGRGYRFWLGGDINNLSKNSGSMEVQFNTPQTELWIRWYVKYEAGFQWAPVHSTKSLYMDTGELQSEFFFGYHGADDLAFRVYDDTRGTIYSNGTDAPATNNGWPTIMGGDPSDGLWHAFEIHIKMDTDGTDGIGQAWIDGNLMYDISDLDFGGGACSGEGCTWETFILSDNQKHPDNSLVCMTVDHDDIAISNTGYIGLLGGPTLYAPFLP